MPDERAINKVIYGGNTLMDITDTTATESDVASGESFYLANGTRGVGTATYAGSATANGPATKTVAIPYGECDGTSTSTAFTATVSGITSLYDGVCVYLKNGVVTSASGWTLNINNLGAYPVYQSQAAASRTSTIYNVAYTGLFVFNSTRIEGGCWDYFYGYNSDTNTIAYQVRRYQTDLVTYTKLYRYQFSFTRTDNTVLPVNAVSNNTGTSKTLTTESFDPFGMIYYYSTTTTVDPGASPGASYMWIEYPTADLRYSFNTGTTLTAKSPVFIKCSPQSDGTFKLSGNDCIVQTLPNTVDGYAYIYLGRAYDTYRITLDLEHPIYYYNNGGLRQWTNSVGDIPSGGTQGQVLTKNSNNNYDTTWSTVNIPTVPTNVSSFTNDAGYITTETDPTVPSWAKQTDPPTYTLTYDQNSSVGSAQVGTAVTGTANYTPSGDIKVVGTKKYTINVPASVSRSFSGSGYDNGIWLSLSVTLYNMSSVDILVPKDITFAGSGVNFIIERDNT